MTNSLDMQNLHSKKSNYTAQLDEFLSGGESSQPITTEPAQDNAVTSVSQPAIQDTPVNTNNTSDEANNVSNSDVNNQTDDVSSDNNVNNTADIQSSTGQDVQASSVDNSNQTIETSSDDKQKNQNKLYAGKYTNTFDLIDGILEEVKYLKGDKKEIASLVEEAQKTGDWSKVENKYKELQAEVTRRIQEQKRQGDKQPSSSADSSVSQPQQKQENAGQDNYMPTQEEYNKVILDVTLRQLKESNLATKFKASGVEIPTTQEELDALELSHPTLWVQFNEAFRQLWNANDMRAKAYLKAVQEAPKHNESELAKTKQRIVDFAKEFDVAIPENEIENFLNEARNNEFLYEMRDGVKFLRDNAVFDWFMAKKALDVLRTIRDKSRVNGINEGAKQVLQNIEKAKKEMPKTISTAKNPPSSVKPQQNKIDLSDYDQARTLGSAAIRRTIDQLLSS